MTATNGRQALLLELTRRIAQGQTVEAVLEAIVDQLRGIVPFDRIEYAVVQGDGFEIRTAWVLDDSPEVAVPVGYLYRRPESISDDPRYREPFIDHDLPTYAKRHPSAHPVVRLAASGFHSGLGCPLVFGEAVVGFLFFTSRTAATYDVAHLEILRAVTAQLAFALELTRLNTELRDRNDELDRLHESRRMLIGLVSHELRTSLTVVTGVGSELLADFDSLTDLETRDYVELMDQSARQAADLVEDLLVSTRIGQDAFDVWSTPTDLGAEVRQVLMAPDCQHIEFRRPSLRPVIAVGDPLRIRQVVRNLLTNANRYGGDKARVVVEDTGSHARVRVIDSGPGVPEAFVEELFTPFSQVDRTAAPGSSGLGLAVSHQLAELMGGSLGYERVDGETVFELTLPLA